MLQFAQSLYLTDILHAASQALLVPVILLLIFFIGYAVFLIGSIVSEALTERRNFRVVMAKFQTSLIAASEEELADVIIDSGLLRRQKVSLLTLWSYRRFPPEALETLAKRLLAMQELRYDRIVGRTDSAVRLAPMVGLMGTLIPLGPGIVALGQGQTEILSQSIGTAFDTTVAGLAAAAVAYVISRIRRNWYENYMGAHEAAMATMLEKIDGMRERGEITLIDATFNAIEVVELAEKEMRDKGITLKELAGASGPQAGAALKDAQASAPAEQGATEPHQPSRPEGRR